MLVAVVQMARDLLIERAEVGLSRAKAEGKKRGKSLIIAPEASDSALPREYDISRATIVALLHQQRIKSYSYS